MILLLLVDSLLQLMVKFKGHVRNWAVKRLKVDGLRKWTVCESEPPLNLRIGRSFRMNVNDPQVACSSDSERSFETFD